MTASKTRRDVFYFHGFDRRGPRYFNLWQKREARRYAEHHGIDLAVGDLDGTIWTIEGVEVATRFHFMDWSDLISARMSKPFWVSLWTMIGLFFVGLKQGYFHRILRKDWAVGALLIWGFIPVALWLLLLVLGGFAGAKAFLGVVGAGLIVFWALKRFDRYFGIAYVADIAWAARNIARGSLPELEARIGAFRRQIEASEAEEIVIIGHSVGAALAVRAAAECPNAALLTVGQSIPLISTQKEASTYRDALRKLKDGAPRWIDVSAGRDLLGFLGFDPSQGGARCVSAHLKRTFGRNLVKSLRWRGFEMHFLYFRASLSSGPWDWMAILSQPPAVLDRFAQETVLSGQGDRRQLF